MISSHPRDYARTLLFPTAQPRSDFGARLASTTASHDEIGTQRVEPRPSRSRICIDRSYPFLRVRSFIIDPEARGPPLPGASELFSN